MSVSRRPPARRARRRLAAAVLAACLGAGLGPPASAEPAPEPPAWRPQVSERLVRLPASVLDKQIDRDFGESSLGKAVREQEEAMRLKTQTLADLDAAIDLAEGEQAVELEHRFLVEKQAFIQVAGEKVRLERQKLETKKRLLEGVMRETKAGDPAQTESGKQLQARRDEARKRLERTMALADRMVGGNPVAGESRYARESEQKLAALDALRERIARHPMSKGPEIDGGEVGKEEYLRHLVAETEGEIALLGMEEEMLGLMARLVALDALALAEKVDDPELVDSGVPEPRKVESAVPFFVR